MNLPNSLTVARIFLVPLLVVVLLTEFEGRMVLGQAWMVAIVVGREFAVTVLRSLAYNRGIVIAASPLGKIKMVAEVVAILLLILGRAQLQQFAVLGEAALWG